MPEFILSHGDALSEGRFNELPAFQRGYIEAAFFTSTGPDNEDEDLGEGTSTGELSPAVFAKAKEDCEDFQRAAASLLASAYATEEYSEKRAGVDFWFTRNGHGAGFWDRGELDFTLPGDERPLGALLTRVAKTFGAVNLVRGDDGRLYLE